MRYVFAALAIFSLSIAAAGAGEPVPKKEGQCVVTKIAKVGNRIDGAADSGDAVTYTNGLVQISAMTIVGLKGSRKGDAVNLCLIALPDDDCPPGDDRGTVYKVTNLRTHKTWQAANSEHDCGGA